MVHLVKPSTLDDVLTFSTSELNNDAKVILLALVRRQQKHGVRDHFPIDKGHIPALLGTPPADVDVALMQLKRYDLIRREGPMVALIIGNKILRSLDFGPHANIDDKDLHKLVEGEGEGEGEDPPPPKRPQISAETLLRPIGPGSKKRSKKRGGKKKKPEEETTVENPVTGVDS